MIRDRHLASILFTDIVGYSAMMQHDELLAVKTIKHYLSVLHEKVPAHGGEVLNDYGDGSLCIFHSAIDSLNCAIEIQESLRTDPVVPLRIGLHVGEIFFEDGKVMGDAVNVASRVQSLGLANTILFSSEVLTKIRNHPEYKYVALGDFEFKNIDEPLGIYALVNNGLEVPARDQMSGKLKEKKATGPWKIAMPTIGSILLLLLVVFFVIKWKTGASGKAKAENSIAVLYFDNMSDDPEQLYFSDGITEEITSRLSNIPDLRVKNRKAVLQYRNQQKPMRVIARELGVSKILQGSVRKQGNEVMITVQLINGATEENLWSITYNRDLKDIFNVQSDIAQQVASKFDLRFSAATRDKLKRSPTTNAAAYDQYLKAIGYANLESGLGGNLTFSRMAIDLLKKAILKDSSFADAKARLSERYAYIAANSDEPERWLDSADYFAREAIRTDPQSETGYISLANVRSVRGQIDESLELLMSAERIKPFSSTVAITNIYLAKHAFGKVYEWLEKAKLNDPYDPIPYATECWMYMSLGMLDSMKVCIDRARMQLKEAAEMDQPLLHYYLFTNDETEYRNLSRKIYARDEKQYTYSMGRYYIFQRNWNMADSFFRISAKPDEMDAGLIKMQTGQKDAGRQMIEKTIAERIRFVKYYHAWHAYDISRCYASLSDHRYIDYFYKAFEKGWNDYIWFKHDPFFDPVRNTPEFVKLWNDYNIKNERFKADLYRSIKRLKN